MPKAVPLRYGVAVPATEVLALPSPDEIAESAYKSYATFRSRVPACARDRARASAFFLLYLPLLIIARDPIAARASR